MKYLQLEAFQKQIKQSFPKHFSPVYLLTTPESSSVFEWMCSIFPKDIDLLRTDNWELARDHLKTASLFGHLPVAYYFGPLDPLSSYVENPETRSILIVSAEKGGDSLYKKGKKEMVWLDLKGEKPWEKSDRLRRMIGEKLKLGGKKFTPDIVESLLKRGEENSLLIDREIEKLLLYAEGKETLSKQDVDAVCQPLPEEEGFILAEKIVFSRGKKAPATFSDLSELLALVGPLRYVLEKALCLVTPGAPPSITPRMLEKYRKKIGDLPASYFAEGLKALFKLELQAKSQAGSPQVLYETFRANL